MKLFEYIFTYDKKFPASRIVELQQDAQGSDHTKVTDAKRVLLDAGQGFWDDKLPQWNLMTDEIIVALDNAYTAHLQKQSMWFGIPDGECASAFVMYLDAAKTSLNRIMKKKTGTNDEEQTVIDQVEAKITYMFDDQTPNRIGDLPIITPSVPMDVAKWLSNGALSVAEVSQSYEQSSSLAQTR